MSTTGTVSDFTIYNELYQTAQLEALALHLDIFNAGSQGALILGDERITGNFRKHTIFDLPDIISHRDNTSTSGVTDVNMTDSENIEVKTNMRIGPVRQTLDAFIKKGMTPEAFNEVVGRTIAVRKIQNQVALATSILAGKLANVAGVTVDVSGDSAYTVTTDVLARALTKFGDAAGDIVCWVMHSKAYFDLVRNAISDKIYNESGLVVYGGSPGTLGKPVVITDGGLTSYTSPTTYYYTLGLTAGALSLIQSEPDIIVAQTLTGYQNLTVRIQGEYALNVAMRNVKWGSTANPNAAALATHSNWTALYADVKQLPGVVIKSK